MYWRNLTANTLYKMNGIYEIIRIFHEQRVGRKLFSRIIKPENRWLYPLIRIVFKNKSETAQFKSSVF